MSHTERLEAIAENLQIGWNSVARFRLHIMSVQPNDPDLVEYGFDIAADSEVADVPGIIVEWLVVFPVKIAVKENEWGWRIRRSNESSGQTTTWETPESVKYLTETDFNTDEALIASIIGEIAAVYALNVIRNKERT